MKPHGRMEVYLHSFLTSTLDGREWSASRSGCFVPEESAECDPESVWTVSRGEKMSCPHRQSHNSRSAVQPAVWLLQRHITVRTNSNGNCSIQYVKFALEKDTRARPEGQYRYSSTLSFTSALDGVGGHRHAPVALPLERPGYHCAEGWMGPKASLNGRGKSRPHWDSISDNRDRCLYTSSTCKKQLITGNFGGLMLHTLILIL